ncbi:MAG: GNAT family N-acetyltransferase [Candidatus Eisenbacteria bacterium]|nr:GNAT family protein [Candidatus Eisenbacteria bacterium]
MAAFRAFPSQVIRTRRLILDSFHAEDAPALFAYRSDPEVCRYQSWEPASLDEVVAFLGDLAVVEFATPGTWFQIAIRPLEAARPGTLVGDIGVHFPADQRCQVEIGFTISPAYQRRGFATEAVTALLDHLFGPMNKHRVYASVDPRNSPSIALLRRLGMRQEAHFQESLWFKGAWAGDLVFAILQSEWRARSGAGHADGQQRS